MKKRALICGVSGQDGAYLSKHLLNKGYEVVGTSRNAEQSAFSNLKALGVEQSIDTLSMDPSDFASVISVLKKIEPTEIYNLSGQSSVSLSFSQPTETFKSIVIATLNILEGMRAIDNTCKFYNAASSEIFGDTGGKKANENTMFNPLSPYGVAKAAAVWNVRNYRKSYGLYACSGILFNHESPLRPINFVTRKIVHTACQIKLGNADTLEMGNLEIRRDWGWAPEYVEAMHEMLQIESPKDFIIATGETSSLKDFVQTTFEILNLNWKEHVTVNKKYFRPNELLENRADPRKAKRELGWSARLKMRAIIEKLVESELQNSNKENIDKRLAAKG
ncbi:MAG: GDP-mannose 4,6-dehydratase [Gammaproteobacteria bacterium]|nr:GDP-mannose 4,6-dehydratase [Gammaproteobacteria bacterium]